MDYSSWKLSTDMGVPHPVVVKKLKKYAGTTFVSKFAEHKGQKGRIFRKKPLQISRYGSFEGQTIYTFNKSHYDECSKVEAKYMEKNREQARKNALKNLVKKK
tara:strand:+ start:4912 stop:5220 length:309 start_codon:yes stop_codon:yes gene_type:complete